MAKVHRSGGINETALILEGVPGQVTALLQTREGPDGELTDLELGGSGGAQFVGVTDPVVVAFDDGDLADLGVVLPFPDGTIPIYVVGEVAETFDAGNFGITNTAGNLLSALGSGGGISNLGAWVTGLDTVYNDYELDALFFKRTGGDPPAEGSVTVRVVYVDPAGEVAAPEVDAPGAILTYGPYPVDFSDFEADGDEVILLTPTVGTHCVGWYAKPSTAETFVFAGEGSPTLRLGQTIDPGVDEWCNFSPDPGGGPTWQSGYAWLNSGSYPIRPDITGGMTYILGLDIVDDTPVRVKVYLDGNDAPTEGHMDLFFQFTTPIAPS